MKQLMPLKRAVVEITNEAEPNDPQGSRRAIKSWHNRLSNGTVPRRIIRKLGRELFLDLEAWEEWLAECDNQAYPRKLGRLRTDSRRVL